MSGERSERPERRRQRSRSPSMHSEEERRVRRRRDGDLDIHSDERISRHSGRNDASSRNETRESRHEGRDGQRSKRRSYSPRAEDSSRRHRRRTEDDSGRGFSEDQEGRRRGHEEEPTARDRSERDDGRSRHHIRHTDRQDRPPRPRTDSEQRRASFKDDADQKVTRKSNGPLPSQADSFSHNKDPSMALVPAGDGEVIEKQKPNFAPTGLLAAESKTVAQADGTTIVLKYHEPPEARKPPPRDQWKLFVFKGSEIVETIELGMRSCWLVGRERAVVDLPAEHPSISKQHAVIQFRWIEKRNEYGDKTGRVRPYLIDLESANGTLMNKDRIEAQRYIELRDKDMIQFGHSTREYVLMLPPKD